MKESFIYIRRMLNRLSTYLDQHIGVDLTALFAIHTASWSVYVMAGTEIVRIVGIWMGTLYTIFRVYDWSRKKHGEFRRYQKEKKFNPSLIDTICDRCGKKAEIEEEEGICGTCMGELNGLKA